MDEEFLKDMDAVRERHEVFKNKVFNHVPISDAIKSAGINKAAALNALVNNVISCYSIVLRYDADTNVYTATTEELKDLCVGKGKSYEIAFNTLIDELNGYCLRMMEDGGVIALPGEI